MDGRRGFGDLIARHLTGSRRRSVYSRMAGYEDVNDARRLPQDPTFRLVGSENLWQDGAALTSRLQSLETELPTHKENRAGLTAINRKSIAKAQTILPFADRASSAVQTIGKNCYFPRLSSNRSWNRTSRNR